MNVLCLCIGTCNRSSEDIKILSISYFLDEFFWFQKNSIKEIFIFIIKNIFARAKKDTHTAVTYKGYYIYSKINF